MGGWGGGGVIFLFSPQAFDMDAEEFKSGGDEDVRLQFSFLVLT